MTATAWADGIEEIKKAIGKYSNSVMDRYKLMFKMPASDYDDWRKWGQELLEQAKRCKYEEHTAEKAELDALLYQCPNQQWKDKIMEGTLDFQECIDWGMTKLTAKEEGQKIGDKTTKTDTPVLPLEKLETDKKFVDCKKCFEKHVIRDCPAWGYKCSKCHTPNHLANSRECKDKAKPPPPGAERGGRGCWQSRGRGGVEKAEAGAAGATRLATTADTTEATSDETEAAPTRPSTSPQKTEGCGKPPCDTWRR